MESVAQVLNWLAGVSALDKLSNKKKKQLTSGLKIICQPVTSSTENKVCSAVTLGRRDISSSAAVMDSEAAAFNATS